MKILTKEDAAHITKESFKLKEEEEIKEAREYCEKNFPRIFEDILIYAKNGLSSMPINLVSTWDNETDRIEGAYYLKIFLNYYGYSVSYYDYGNKMEISWGIL